jgi:tetratricopeptide (TPR) repeat protein
MSKQTLGDVFVILGVVCLRTGKFKQAETWIKKALKIRETAGDKTRIAACYLDLGLNYYQKLNIKLSEKFYTKALDIFEAIGHQQYILYTLNNLGALYGFYNLPKAETYYLRALKQAKLIGAKRTIVYLHNNLGAIEYNRMMTDQAVLHYKQALKQARAMNFHEGVVFSSLDLSELYREAGQIKKGKSYLERAKKVAEQIDMKYFYIDCLKDEMEYNLLAKNNRKAHTLFKKILTQIKKDRSITYKIDSFIYQAKLLVAQKKYARAHYYYGKASSCVKSLPPNRTGGEIYYLRGIVYKKEGRLKKALEMFLEANRICETIGNLRFLDKIEKEIASADL